MDTLLNISASGFYTLNDPEKFMKATHLGSIVAVGLRASDVLYLASIRIKDVNTCFISTPVKDESDITLELICQNDWDEIEFLWRNAHGQSEK